MITKNYPASKQFIKQKYTSNQNTPKVEVSKTLSWYIGRVEQLESEQQKLNHQIKECHSYLDYQSNNSRRLKAKIREMRKIYEDTSNASQWIIIPRAFIHKAIIAGLVLFTLGLILSILDVGYFII